MDHVSLSWSNDELIGINCLDSECYNRDIGIQNSILSEALKGHSTGTLISGKIDYCLYENPIDATCNITEPVEYWRNVKDISYHHNLLAHNGWRNPLIKTQDVQFVNNVVYKPWKKFNFNKKYKNIIFWRNFGLSTILPFNNIKADFIAVDVHDNFIQGLENIFRLA